MIRRFLLLGAMVLVGVGWAVAVAQPPIDPPRNSPGQKSPVPKTPPPPSPAALMPLELYGSIADSAKADAAPASRVITTDKDWVALTMAWGIKDPPKVDLTKELLVVATTKGDKLVIQTRLDEKGDLRITALDSDDNPRGGFRYGIKAVDRAGVKTVDGMPLPME
ncbi:MAG: hypothetical protein JWO38_4839 [Gemmataceae bacterium]|nr:hypothetical protein [Gemmataceae bacterium]